MRWIPLSASQPWFQDFKVKPRNHCTVHVSILFCKSSSHTLGDWGLLPAPCSSGRYRKRNDLFFVSLRRKCAFAHGQKTWAPERTGFVSTGSALLCQALSKPVTTCTIHKESQKVPPLNCHIAFLYDFFDYVLKFTYFYKSFGHSSNSFNKL